jgi:cytochrome c oxidase subunit 3
MIATAQPSVSAGRGARLVEIRSRPRGKREPVEPTLLPGVVGVLVLIISETMFFGGLLSAYLVLRAGALEWPPPGQPWLPAGVTALNSLFLFGSGYTMYRALGEVSFARYGKAFRWLAVTAALGLTFLAVQGSEWIRLVRFGLTLKSSLYGALFYTLVGAHGLHVIAAMIALSVALYRLAMIKSRRLSPSGLLPISLYWWFVVALWLVIYVAVYLA